METHLSITVIIPTWKRPETLAWALDSIAQQVRLPDHLFVVYREEDKEGFQVIQDFFGENSNKFKIQPLKAEVPGVVHAENLALSHVEDDLIAFLDDDAEAPPEWLQVIEKFFKKNPEYVGLGGMDYIVKEKDPRYPYPKNEVGQITFYGKIIGHHHQRVEKAQDVQVLKGVNMAIRSRATCLLDERLGSLQSQGNGSHWELDLCFHLKSKGKLYFLPELMVRHHSDHQHIIEMVNQKNNAKNLSYVLLKNLPFLNKIVFLLYVLLIGNTQIVGLLKFLFLIFKGNVFYAAKVYLYSVKGLCLGIINYMKFLKEGVEKDSSLLVSSKR